MDMKLKKCVGKCLVAGLVYAFANSANASYIEAAVGNAVTNDATSVYYNPSGLGFLTNPQLVASLGKTFNRSTFKGTTTQALTGFSQTGTAESTTSYFYPSVYIATPITDRISIGLAGLYTFQGFEDYGQTSILRYIQTASDASLYDITPALSVKIMDNLFVGAGVDFTFAKLRLNSITGFPTFGISDSSSENSGSGEGKSAHVGAIWHPLRGTILGIVYHSPVSLKISGHSYLVGSVMNSTNNFNVNLVAPPSTVFTIDQFVNPRWGFIGTIENMRWGTTRNLVLHNVAFKSGSTPVTLTTVVRPYFLHNTFRYTIGTHYDVNDRWSVRGAYSYDEDPGNPAYQITSGDNIIYSVGTSFKVNKECKLDFSYNYTSYKTMNINISTGSNRVVGQTSGGRNSAQAKIIWNFV